MQNKEADSVIRIVKNWSKERYLPKTLITYYGRKFLNNKFKEFIKELEIEHHMVVIKAHRSNGRIERAIHTIRHGLGKVRNMPLEDKVEKIIHKYNMTYHAGIKCSFIEALEEKFGSTEEQGPP